MIAMRSALDSAGRCVCQPHGVAAALIVMADVIRKSRRFILEIRWGKRYLPARIRSRRRLRSSNGMLPLLSIVIQPL